MGKISRDKKKSLKKMKRVLQGFFLRFKRDVIIYALLYRSGLARAFHPYYDRKTYRENSVIFFTLSIPKKEGKEGNKLVWLPIGQYIQ